MQVFSLQMPKGTAQDQNLFQSLYLHRTRLQPLGMPEFECTSHRDPYPHYEQVLRKDMQFNN